MIPVESEVRVVFLTRSFDDVLLQPIELVTIYLHCSPPLFSVQEGHRRTPAHTGAHRAGSRADKDERHFFVSVGYYLKLILGWRTLALTI